MHKVLWFCESVVSLIPCVHCCFIPECPLRLRSCIPTVPLFVFAFCSVLWFCVLLSWVPTVTLVLCAHCPSGHMDPLSLFFWVPTDPLVPYSGYCSVPMWPLSLLSRVPTLIPQVLYDRRPSGHACPSSLIRTRDMKGYPFSISFLNFRLLCCWIVINKLLV